MSQPLTFLYGQAVRHCTHHIDKHFEDYYTLQYMAGGKVMLKIDEQAYNLGGRWFWSCYPGPHMDFHADPPGSTWNHRYLAFRGRAVQSWIRQGLFPIAPQVPPHRVDYAMRFDELLALSRRDDPWGTRRAIHLLEGILIELAEARNVRPADPLAERAISMLHDSAYELSESQLAAELGVSQRTLRRRFVAATGLPPRRYLIKQRIETAKTLLAETRLPIKEIARQLQYHDVFFFTRQFSATTGVSPARYRRSCTG